MAEVCNRHLGCFDSPSLGDTLRGLGVGTEIVWPYGISCVCSSFGIVCQDCRVSLVRQFPDASWWLKFDRALHHLSEYKSAVAKYQSGRKHRVSCIRETKGQYRGQWSYRIHIAGEPDAAWSCIIGDFLFDMRASLDHMVVALNPKRLRREVYFPILAEDPWRREGSRYIERDPRNRRSLRKYTESMPEGARTWIEMVQPYYVAREQGGHPEDAVLLMLQRLNNADKHQELLIQSTGFMSGRLRYELDGTLLQVDIERGIRLANKTGRRAYFAPKDGAVVMRMPFEVEMDLVGSAVVSFSRTKPAGTYECTHFDALVNVVEGILIGLECFGPRVR